MAMLNGPAIKNEIIEELLKSVSKPEDLLGQEGLLKQLTARLVERALQAEMSHHLGFEPGQEKPAGGEPAAMTVPVSVKVAVLKAIVEATGSR